jgi:hypothetical protein
VVYLDRTDRRDIERDSLAPLDYLYIGLAQRVANGQFVKDVWVSSSQIGYDHRVINDVLDDLGCYNPRFRNLVGSDGLVAGCVANWANKVLEDLIRPFAGVRVRITNRRNHKAHATMICRHICL